jgi:hypothetical protein
VEEHNPQPYRVEFEPVIASTCGKGRAAGPMYKYPMKQLSSAGPCRLGLEGKGAWGEDVTPPGLEVLEADVTMHSRCTPCHDALIPCYHDAFDTPRRPCVYKSTLVSTREEGIIASSWACAYETHHLGGMRRAYETSPQLSHGNLSHGLFRPDPA